MDPTSTTMNSLLFVFPISRIRYPRYETTTASGVDTVNASSAPSTWLIAYYIACNCVKDHYGGFISVNWMLFLEFMFCYEPPVLESMFFVMCSKIAYNITITFYDPISANSGASGFAAKSKDIFSGKWVKWVNIRSGFLRPAAIAFSPTNSC